MRAHLFTPRRLVEEPAEPVAGSAGKLREASSLLLIAGAAYLVLALAGIRIDPNDPSVQGADWCGAVGTAIGSLLARGFGFAAWFVPLELGVVALPLFKPGRMPVTSLRLAGDLVLMILVAALVHIAAPDAAAFGGGTSGGNVGLFFGELMRALFSAIGSFLVGGTAVGLILIGRSQLSFIAWIDRLTRAGLWFEAKLVASFARMRGAWREARIVRQEREDEERAAALPVIESRSKDEVILAHLEDGDSDWLPIDKTGEPPIALSQALRDAITQRGVALAAAGVEPSPASGTALDHRSVVPPSAPPAKKRARKNRDESLFALEEDEPAAEAVPETPSPSPRAVAAPAPARKPPAESNPLEPTIVDTSPEREVKRGQRRPERRKGGFQLPATDMLAAAPPAVSEVDKRRVYELSERLERTLLDYGVVGKVVEIHPGPTVTTYEVAPEAGTKVSKIASLVDDLALGLSRKVRIVAPIPGKSRIGFELPNDERQPVGLRELVEDKRFDALAEKAPLPVVLGRDIVGAPFYADLASMPHVIVAGATGAGKSVGLNVMLTSLLFRRTPDELRLLMIDPKVVELAPFDGIPHMLLPVVTDMKQAAKALKWAVDEMERRYQLFANAGTKNIGTYNRWAKRIEDGEIPPPDPSEVQAIAADGQLVSVPSAKEGADGAILPGKLPFIVIVVDEFADLMMQQGKDVETAVARLAQKARAAGMHVVLATQRPSVDVITGMIKANFPTRIAFRVAQKVDSRTILDEQGSELLLGKGDMLVKMNGSNEMRRVQCPFVSEEEVEALTTFLRSQGTPTYHDAILQRSDDDEDAPAEEEAADPRFDEAVRIVAETKRCSTSWLQRKMTIGYNRAAKIVEMMEKLGMVGAPNGARDREVLLQPH